VLHERDIDHNGIAELIEDQKRQFLLSFMMCVIGDQRIFDILGPAVNPVTGRIAGGAHFWRTIPPIVTGYTNPGDGSYAQASRAAHEAAGFPPKLVAESKNWHVNILCELAVVSGRKHLVTDIVHAGKNMTKHFGCPSAKIAYNPEMLRRHFTPINLDPNMVEALWGVLSWAQLAELLGNPTPDEVLVTCSEILPPRFVHQFTPPSYRPVPDVTA
jgi:hypothetical protein